MNKLFVSCPMRGRTQADIEVTISKMHAIAEKIFDKELKLVNSYDPNMWIPTGANEQIFALSRSLQFMSQADYFIGIREPHDWHGCLIESIVAISYGLKHTKIDAEIVMPDLQS